MDVLIQTKLAAPPQRARLLARPSLVASLRAGLAGLLTLIAAPAGFGKTTLALEGIAAYGGSTAWLALDEGDNDSTRFLAYLIAALEKAQPSHLAGMGDLLAGPQPASPQFVLSQLANHIAAAGDDIVLVLDDYHVIRNAAVHAQVAFLLEHAPPVLHLLLITRSDPPLPLARLRARAHLVELRAADLRFTPGEAAAFLEAVMDVHLTADLAASLAERTEGWVAGLQLAALRLRQPDLGPEDAAAFVRSFSGTHRYILDYLLDEVLELQPPAVQRFLLLTSPLRRMCGPLCDAVLQTAAAPGEVAVQNAAAQLIELERSNAFVTALDDERQWYRYHHLFGDLLRARLHERYAALEPALNAAAGRWLEAHGCTVEAIDAALASGDEGWAARLVEENTVGLLARGELAALLSWIGALPLAVRRQRPGLCVQQAYALAFAGHLDEAAAALDLAAETHPPKAAENGAVAAVRAMLAVMSGNEEQAVALADTALALLPLPAWWDRAAACWALGYARRSLGDLVAARACFAEQIRLARALHNVWTLVTGLTDLALVLRAQGELRPARALLEEALAAAAEQGARGLGYIARVETTLAVILCDEGDWLGAEQLLAAAFAHVERWPNPNHIVYAYLVAARVQEAQRNEAAAQASVQRAAAAVQAAPVTRVLRDQVAAALARLEAGAPPSRGAVIEGRGLAQPVDEPLVEPLVEPLSAREREVLLLLAQGLTNQEIAAQLIVAPGTIKAHTAAIYRKLDVANRTEAASRARQIGLLT